MIRPRTTVALAALLLCGAAPRAPIRLGPEAPKEPKRIVTLAPSLTETVLALGAGERLIGVTRFDDAPEVRALPRVGGYIDPSVEAVLALRPELVLVEPSPGNRAAVERMAALGAPIFAVHLGTQEEILAGLRDLGEALGLAERGEALAAATAARLEAVARRSKSLRKVRTLVVYDWEPLVVAGPGSFADRLLEQAGAANAAAGARSAYPVYSAELAMRAAPEVIIDAADVPDPPRERILKLPGLDKARVSLASPNLFRPGPRLAEALEEVSRIVHPEAKDERAQR